MTIGKGTHRLVPIELLGAAAGALQHSVNAKNTLELVRAAIKEDGPQDGEFAGFMAFGCAHGVACSIPDYSGLSEFIVKDKILNAARREGYRGTIAGRMLELGWWIEPVYRRAK